jgi:hypothetical protein
MKELVSKKASLIKVCPQIYRRVYTHWKEIARGKHVEALHEMILPIGFSSLIEHV